MAVMAAARRCAGMYHRLDGVLTLAHSIGDPGSAAPIVRYEVEDGLIDDLTRFRRDCLSRRKIAAAPRLASLRSMTDATLDFFSSEGTSLTRVLSAERSVLHAFLMHFRDLDRALEEIVDGCVAQLAVS